MEIVVYGVLDLDLDSSSAAAAAAILDPMDFRRRIDDAEGGLRRHGVRERSSEVIEVAFIGFSRSSRRSRRDDDDDDCTGQLRGLGDPG